MRLSLNPRSLDDYRTFLKVKTLPSYRVIGRDVEFPDEYANRLGSIHAEQHSRSYTPIPELFDYQCDIAKIAIQKRKFAAFVDCGYGKTLIMTEFARYANESMGGRRRVLIVSPLMVIPQTIEAVKTFYRGRNDITIAQVKAADLQGWMNRVGDEIGITNYEALTDDLSPGRLGALILDESSMLKSHYGKWGQICLRLGAGLDWKLALTGTPAPNDRIEYANHAVFLDAFPTVNAFLAKFFVNRGQTNERWELKPHALVPFYRALSHWCIFLSNPSTYGWRDNADPLPPIHVHIHDVDLTASQIAAARDLTGSLFVVGAGGIGGRSKLARIAKTGDTLKAGYIRDLISTWPDESTLVWCRFNDEQDRLAEEMPCAASISGSTPINERIRIIDAFKSGNIKTLISKPKILGFGLNLQIATRQMFSSLHDSYEEYYQAVKRSNRVGSTRPLNVHIPVTEVERPMIETVLRKAAMIQHDTEQQERMFRDAF